MSKATKGKPGSNDPHHYVECGLPNIWLENGFKRQETPYGTGVAIQNLAGLHRCIATALCDKPEPLSGAEFRFLRRELDYSETDLGSLLGRTARLLRNIEHRVEVEQPYDNLIRHVYLESIKPETTYAEEVTRRDSLHIEWTDELRLLADKRRAWKSDLAPAAVTASP